MDIMAEEIFIEDIVRLLADGEIRDSVAAKEVDGVAMYVGESVMNYMRHEDLCDHEEGSLFRLVAGAVKEFDGSVVLPCREVEVAVGRALKGLVEQRGLAKREICVRYLGRKMGYHGVVVDAQARGEDSVEDLLGPSQEEWFKVAHSQEMERFLEVEGDVASRRLGCSPMVGEINPRVVKGNVLEFNVTFLCEGMRGLITGPHSDEEVIQHYLAQGYSHAESGLMAKLMFHPHDVIADTIGVQGEGSLLEVIDRNVPQVVIHKEDGELEYNGIKINATFIWVVPSEEFEGVAEGVRGLDRWDFGGGLSE